MSLPQNAYSKLQKASPRSIANQLMPSTYNSENLYKLYSPQIMPAKSSLNNQKLSSPSEYNNSQYKISTPIPIPTSLKLNNDLNILEYQNNIKKAEYSLDRNKELYLKYISQRRTPDNIIKTLKQNSIQHQQNPYIFPCRDVDMSFKYIEDENGNIHCLNPEEAQRERQKNYFFQKQQNNNDFQRFPYINYLQGKFEKCIPNAYNSHVDYLGESKLKHNTITNPMGDYMANKYLFKSLESNKTNSNSNNSSSIYAHYVNDRSGKRMYNNWNHSGYNIIYGDSK